MRDLYKTLCATDVLKAATNYVYDDKKDDFIPDVFHNQDYFFNLQENLNRLAQSLKNGTYHPRPLKEIDVPKSGLAVRPGSSLDIEDHIVFFAIAYLLAPIMDRILPASVFHFRVKRKGKRPHPDKFFQNEGPVLISKDKRKQLQLFDDWYEAWPEFVAEAQSIYAKEGFTIMVETDISAYFENISHPLLVDILRKYAPHQLRLINLLMEMISFWTIPSLTGFRPQRGIPQGNEVSSWLGTLYLVEMDIELLKLQRKGMIRYVRYVDDIKVFTKDTKTARSVIFIINRILRRLHLNIQTSKTQIFEGDDVHKRLYDERVEHVTKIIDGLPKDLSKITRKQRQTAEVIVRPAFKHHLAYKRQMEKEDFRLFKRILTLLSRIQSPMAVNQALKSIWVQPALTEKVSRYLSNWMGRQLVHSKVERALLGEEELFDAQYLYLLPMFRNSAVLNLKHKGPIMRLACGGAYHWAVRAEAFLCLILFPLSKSDFEKLRRCYFKETSPTVKKILLSLFLKASGTVMKRMFSATIQEPEEETNRFRKYLWALTNDAKLGQSSLAALNRFEKDHARLIAILHGALLSKNIGTLHLVLRIADEHCKVAPAELVRRAFAQVSSDAKQMIESLSSKRTCI